MKVYEQKYNTFNNGLYVTIRDDQAEIINKRYSTEVLAELYYHKLIIIPDEMKVVLMNRADEVLSIIRNAKRIVDMRDN